MRSWFVLLVCCLSVCLGCGNSPKGKNDSSSKSKTVESKDDLKKVGSAKNEELESEENSFKPFYIYKDIGSRDNHYAPSGFMPNGNCITFNDKWTEECHSGSTCIKIEYDVECSRNDERWAGVYWLNPPNNWGQRKGGYNLTGATKLTFWAKGAEGGEQIQEFTIGGITGNYPDSDTAVIGPVILMPEWRQYTIDLRGKDLTYISGGFSWTTSEEVNPESCNIYIDDIRFE